MVQTMHKCMFFRTHFKTSRSCFKSIFYEVKRETGPFFLLNDTFLVLRPRLNLSQPPKSLVTNYWQKDFCLKIFIFRQENLQ